jgi:hypothetical protein
MACEKETFFVSCLIVFTATFSGFSDRLSSDVSFYGFNNKVLHYVAICIIFVTIHVGGENMTTAVRVSEDLVKQAKIYSKIDKRSLTGQIEYWAMIGKCAEENPDLTYSLIKEIFIGLTELDQGEYSEYKFG